MNSELGDTSGQDFVYWTLGNRFTHADICHGNSSANETHSHSCWAHSRLINRCAHGSFQDNFSGHVRDFHEQLQIAYLVYNW